MCYALLLFLWLQVQAEWKGQNGRVRWTSSCSQCNEKLVHRPTRSPKVESRQRQVSGMDKHFQFLVTTVVLYVRYNSYRT